MRITIKAAYDTGEDLVLLIQVVKAQFRSDGMRVTVLKGAKVECPPVELAHDGELEIVPAE